MTGAQFHAFADGEAAALTEDPIVSTVGVGIGGGGRAVGFETGHDSATGIDHEAAVETHGHVVVAGANEAIDAGQGRTDTAFVVGDPCAGLDDTFDAVGLGGFVGSHHRDKNLGGEKRGR